MRITSLGITRFRTILKKIETNRETVSMTTLITSCRLVTPGLELDSASILVENDRIRAILPACSTLPAAD